MSETETDLCPRCMENPADDFGTSRTDSTTNICTACNTAEALDDFLLGAITPQDEWPVRREAKSYPLKSQKASNRIKEN